MLSIELCGTPNDLILRFLNHTGTELTHEHPHDVLEAFEMIEREFGIKQSHWKAEI
jgi:hypothetical protein